MAKKKEQKVYMPLMIGDWLKGTRGMKAEVRGVYLGLLLYQWDNGFIPSDMEELCLIDPELPKVWDKIKSKFVEIEPGKLQNKKNVEVKEFWSKQKKNGGKGGRPKNNNPKVNPDTNPNNNPNDNLQYDLDIEHEVVIEIKKELNQKNDSRETKDAIWSELSSDEIYMEQIAMTHRGKDAARAFSECYIHHSNAPNPPTEIGEWKQKLNTWLINSKHNGKAFNKNDRTEFNQTEYAIITAHASSGGGT